MVLCYSNPRKSNTLRIVHQVISLFGLRHLLLLDYLLNIPTSLILVATAIYFLTENKGLLHLNPNSLQAAMARSECTGVFLEFVQYLKVDGEIICSWMNL